MPTREEFEANWGWDPKKGSIPFKRLRLTDKNVKAQAELARPGTLVHWSGKLCKRGNAKTDVRRERTGPDLSKPRNESLQLQAGWITYLGEASNIENVNCLACRWLYFAAQQDRAAKRREAKVVKMIEKAVRKRIKTHPLPVFQGGKS